jgi:hypothetical protein
VRLSVAEARRHPSGSASGVALRDRRATCLLGAPAPETSRARRSTANQEYASAAGIGVAPTGPSSSAIRLRASLVVSTELMVMSSRPACTADFEKFTSAVPYGARASVSSPGGLAVSAAVHSGGPGLNRFAVENWVDSTEHPPQFSSRYSSKNSMRRAVVGRPESGKVITFASPSDRVMTWAAASSPCCCSLPLIGMNLPSNPSEWQLTHTTTTPAWTPLFGTAAAVVTDAGGVLSHCAIVAREYGIGSCVHLSDPPLVVTPQKCLTHAIQDLGRVTCEWVLPEKNGETVIRRIGSYFDRSASSGVRYLVDDCGLIGIGTVQCPSQG